MKLYNTLSRKKEDFTPLHDKKVSMYTCGLTVYSQPHIGNWVAYIYWDILERMLRHEGYDVERVQNITDVGHLVSDDDDGEDKLQKGANAEGVTAWDIAEKYTERADHEAFDLLNLLRPAHMPKATDFVAQQIAFIEALEKKGFTYKIEDGVYFDTSKLSDYGKLAQLDIEGLKSGARVEDTGKKHITDFALWKFSPSDSKRDMEWESPWGTGFPGWHLECSVMARELLGDQIDIHTGGIDHIPIHHTNEIAQTEALTNKPFAQTWIHANHIKVDGTKMSKSLGNIYTLEDVQKRGFSFDSFKLLVLSKQYRTEGNFTWEILEAAQNRLQNWQTAFDTKWQIPEDIDNTEDEKVITEANARVLAALRDDLDTPNALAEIESVIRLIENRGLSRDLVPAVNETIRIIDELLGITIINDDITDEEKQLIKERSQARENNDWSTSDKLRDTLLEHGLSVRDTNDGTFWSRI